jgi:hypothetical protein
MAHFANSGTDDGDGRTTIMTSSEPGKWQRRDHRNTRALLMLAADANSRRGASTIQGKLVRNAASRVRSLRRPDSMGIPYDEQYST